MHVHVQPVCICSAVVSAYLYACGLTHLSVCGLLYACVCMHNFYIWRSVSVTV